MKDLMATYSEHDVALESSITFVVGGVYFGTFFAWVPTTTTATNAVVVAALVLVAAVAAVVVVAAQVIVGHRLLQILVLLFVHQRDDSESVSSVYRHKALQDTVFRFKSELHVCSSTFVWPSTKYM